MVVVPVVGNRNYLDANSTTPLTFARPSDPPAPESEGEGPEIDLEACCGDGVCESSVTASCASDLGAALTGERCLELADAFPSPGIGCPVGAPANGEPCTTICDADFPSALNAAVSPLGARPFSTCLPATPDCRVGQRPCTDIESRSAERIDSSVQVATTCPDGAEGCVPDALGPADYIIDREAACATGFEVTLTDTYPPGTRLSITIKPAPAADCL